MPISKISASEAIETIKSNPNSRWPQRADFNRLSPMAKPVFSTDFTLPAGGKIFTIGSCFARNVEGALRRCGFDLPALDVLARDDEFAAIGSQVMNNYGVPSIYNELRWAFEDEIDEDTCFYQSRNGWIDLHTINRLRDNDLETLRTRRRALRDSYRSIADCDAVIITLGLSEVWFDTQSGLYLNMPPRRSVLREAPDRFELHTLSYGETIQYLRDAIDLIHKHGRTGIQVIVTVSPVPLNATYRDMDVMLANTYSKSVLRAAAEEITHLNDFVHYFPSYESITLSERSVAYKDDEIHVTQDIIDLNISRMMDAYTGAAQDVTLEAIKLELDVYRARPKQGFDALIEHLEFCADPDVAAALTECATAIGRFDVADMALKLARDNSGMLAAQLHFAKGDPNAALDAIKSKPEDARRLVRYRRLRILANIITDKYDAAVEATQEWADTTPFSPTPFKVLADALAQHDHPRAEDWYIRAVEVSGDSVSFAKDLAEYREKTNERAQYLQQTG